MKWARWKHAATALAVATAVALPASALGAESKKDRGEKQEASEEKQKSEEKKEEKRQLEVFELEHRDPQHLSQIISLAARMADGQATLPGRPGQIRPVPHAAGYRGAAGDQVVMAVHPEEKLLFVRGTEEQLSEMRSLVEALDVEDDQLEAHDHGELRLIPIRGKLAGQIQSTLTQLNLQGQFMPMGNVTLAVFPTDDEEAEQAEEVIRRFNARVADDEQRDDQRKDPQEKDRKQDKEGQDQDREENAGTETG